MVSIVLWEHPNKIVEMPQQNIIKVSAYEQMIGLIVEILIRKRKSKIMRGSPISDASTTTLPTRPHHQRKPALVTPEQSESGAADVRLRGHYKFGSAISQSSGISALS